MPQTTYKKIKIAGIVIPTDWDETGNTTAVSLSTENENILLQPDSISKDELLGLIQKIVEIRGMLFATGINKRIYVSGFTLKKSWD
jgi:hypothetical protein